MDGFFSRREKFGLALGMLCGLVAGIGCMSFNLGNKTVHHPSSSFIAPNGNLIQHDLTPLIKTMDNRIMVYYPRPFATKPNLILCKETDSVPANEIELLIQEPDHFVVSWKGNGSDAQLSWRAEGIPVPAGNAPSPKEPAIGPALGVTKNAQ